MKTNEPEYQLGWRNSYTLDGTYCIIRANHRKTQRIPKPHEIVRLQASGKPIGMVTELHRQWTITATINGRQHSASIVPLSNGRLHVVGTGRNNIHDTLQAAAANYIAYLKSRHPDAPR